MACVAEILRDKGAQVHCVSPDATVHDTIALMVQMNVGSILVTDGDEIAGIFTERDFLRRVTLQDRDPKTTRVREVMTDRLVCVHPDRKIEECMAMMTQERIRHLPVMVDGRVAGMISIGDLVKHVSREQEVEIRYLTDYITGRV